MSADRVILLHGIAASPLFLAKMARRLRACGYQTLNLKYPSRKRPLEGLVDEVHARVSDFLAPTGGQVHFVTHSMGGLVARAYLTRYRPANLGRVVMLGPPNQGSEMADLLGKTLLYRKFFGPAGAQLGTRLAERLGDLLGPVDYPAGIIAGDRTLDPVSWLILPRPNDGKVTVARTKVAGMADHVTLHATHALMARNADVMRQTVHFLAVGRFDEKKEGRRFF